MAEPKFDFKREYKDLYLPRTAPALIDVPEMTFFAVDGKGSPQGAEYQSAVQALYTLTFTVKMSKKSGTQPEGYFDYALPPLEGFWWCEKAKLDLSQPKDEWLWISVIRQPDFVTREVFEWAVSVARKKKPEADFSRVYRLVFCEGLCVQAMHVGPYADEDKTLAAMRGYAAEGGYQDETGTERKHHEIYLGDPRKTAPEKLRTVLRIPVKK